MLKPTSVTQWKHLNSSFWKVEKQFLHKSANIALLTHTHSLLPKTSCILWKNGHNETTAAENHLSCKSNQEQQFSPENFLSINRAQFSHESRHRNHRVTGSGVSL